MARASLVTAVIGGFGDWVVERLAHIGRFALFSFATVGFIARDLTSLRAWRRLLPQCYQIGAMSVPVIVLTGTFVGMVLVVQGYAQFDASGFSDRLGGIVNISVVAELGPVLAGVMLAGRVGGALTAELGTMNVTEQLLALRSMGADPIRFLATPRFLACLLLAPVLTCYANVAGAFGGWAVYTGVFGAESEPYWAHTRDVLVMWDIGSGLVKSLFFGGVIGLISCYKGFHCRTGAEGVGLACTQAFVASFIAILALDFSLNVVLNKVYELLYGFRSLI